MFFDSLLGIISGLLLIRYAEIVAKYVSDFVGTSIFRDVDNPWTYKIVGGLMIIAAIVSLFLPMIF